MQLFLMEPQGLLWEGPVKQVSLPAAEGEMCVLDFHQPFFIRLVRGVIRASSGSFAVEEGIAVMKGNTLSVFIERAG